MVKLQPLEFIDCLIDSPDFRENLNKHEKELEKTSQQIKRIIKEIKDLLAAAKSLSRAQRTLSKSLNEFNFECIGSTQTDDEQVIADSLKQFSKLISSIEEERDNMLDRAHEQILLPLEEFRKVHIGGVKENKKKYDKKTAKFCQAQERFLNMSSKKSAVIEADASLGMLEREYLRESLSYVLSIQEVQERIKFEFVEIILRFISDWLVFYHLGHEVAEDAKDYLSDLQLKVQKTRENFDETRQKAQELKNKYMDSKLKPESEYTKQGYLYLMEKKFTVVTWSKFYCTYKKQTKEFSMLQYNQMSGRTQQTNPETFTLASCTKKITEFEKRYCFDVIFNERTSITYTFQALSDDDIKAWIDAMDGKESTNLTLLTKHNEDGTLDDVGFAFIKKCIELLESRGLEEEGLYRIGGVSTKVTKLLQMGLDRKKSQKDRLSFFNDEHMGHNDIMESKTIASALKQYLRNLNEPLMTFRLHHAFITAAKQETRLQRINEVHQLVYKLPKNRLDMLGMVIRHLKTVSSKSDRNKMSVFNLGVVFGPTLLRAAEETVAAILDIKFNNVIIEILIENYDKIFKNLPSTSKGSNTGDTYISQANKSPLFQRPDSSSSGIVDSATGGSASTGINHNFPKDRTIHSIYAQTQPVVRVVAKSNYTEPIMSSSLQHIPNGIQSLYSKGTNHYPTYEAKPTIISSIIGESTPASIIIRDQNNQHHLKSTIDQSSSHYHGTHHTVDKVSAGYQNLPAGSALGGCYPPQNQSTASFSQNSSLSGMNSMTNCDAAIPHGVYNRITTLGNSDSNLANSRKELSTHEKINSTSSSAESVCSSPGGIIASSVFCTLRSHRGTWSEYNNAAIGNKNVAKYDSSGPNNNTRTVISPLTTTVHVEESDNSASPSYCRPKKTQRIKDFGRNRQLPQVQQQLSLAQQQYLQQKPGKQSLTVREDIRVRTLYACLAENDGELSFEPNQIITNVRRSNEPGWLEGTLNGKSGLIPENYVEMLK
ncbi:rho GTPase-activating protein Graf isoform X1 [Anopheles moucheti]|uniref:rho GTPase-activating protein Graf isoform X1 n=2 Tax=Anopheles moucheti TaxID=186751 RepID=UPI0022F002BE|nr:rho GTPase-activating protein Graf isoform X1 [Anopheles moucheti]